MNTQTRIKLKGLKIYTGMGHQETVCFRATILFDELNTGTTENDGHSGELSFCSSQGKKDLSKHMRGDFYLSAMAIAMVKHFSSTLTCLR